MKRREEELKIRPVDKGIAPADYADYKDAGADLISRVGEYCSYCERKIETHLAVEHIQPKLFHPRLRNSWGNFLLACVHCNSIKGKRDIVRDEYFWPDRDNTLLVVEYRKGGLVRPHRRLNCKNRVRAKATIALTGLDRTPGKHGREPTGSDKRWLKRQQTWQLAEDANGRLQGQVDNTSLREQIVDTAVSRGMFSIWWTVFAGDVDMRRRLREAFAGTHSASFDVDENPVRREGGQV